MPWGAEWFSLPAKRMASASVARRRTRRGLPACHAVTCQRRPGTLVGLTGRAGAGRLAIELASCRAGSRAGRVLFTRPAHFIGGSLFVFAVLPGRPHHVGGLEDQGSGEPGGYRRG